MNKESENRDASFIRRMTRRYAQYDNFAKRVTTDIAPRSSGQSVLRRRRIYMLFHTPLILLAVVVITGLPIGVMLYGSSTRNELLTNIAVAIMALLIIACIVTIIVASVIGIKNFSKSLNSMTPEDFEAYKNNYEYRDEQERGPYRGEVGPDTNTTPEGVNEENR